METCEAEGAHREARRVDGERVAWPNGNDENACDRGTRELRRRHRHPAQSVRPLQPLRADGHRREPGRGRVEERGRSTGERLQNDQFPDTCRVREQEGSGRGLDSHACDVGGEHHAAPRQAVGEDPADEQEDHERCGLRGDHEAEVACGSGQVEHSPCERERCDRVAEQRYELSGEEQPELALLERAERDPPHWAEAQEPTHGMRGLHAWSAQDSGRTTCPTLGSTLARYQAKASFGACPLRARWVGKQPCFVGTHGQTARPSTCSRAG